MGKASAELELFVDEGVRRGAAVGYYPTVFIGMRERLGTKEAIRQLVTAGDIQTGFKRLLRLSLKAWTIEAAVVRFSGEFDKEAIAAAQWRLDQAEQG